MNMAPVTRRSTRTPANPSRSNSSTPKKSPVKKTAATSPRKKTLRTRDDKKQPRIDEAYQPTSAGLRGQGSSKKQDRKDVEEVEFIEEVESKVGIKIKPGNAYQIGGDRETPTSSVYSSPVTPNARKAGSSATSPSSSFFFSPPTSTKVNFPSPSSSRASSLTTSAVSSPESRVSKLSQSDLDTSTRNAEHNEILKNFDIDGIYGACRGISRRERYDRAISYKLEPPPPQIVLEILDERRNEGTSNYQEKWETCIWDQNDLLLRIRR